MMVDRDTDKDLHNRFNYHPPIGDQTQRYKQIRTNALNFALLINSCCPNSREKDLAMENLDIVVMFANASIARNEK